VADRAVVLVTGASGAIGRPLVASLAARPAIAEVVALAHREPMTAGAPSVHVLAGDVTQDECLGLAADTAAAVASRVTTIIHAAANTRFNAPASASRTNVDGTRHVLAFARRCPRLNRIVALSTTHVAGRRTGQILEDELQHDAGFVNGYEASKYQSELELRDAMSALPIAVARLSTAVADSQTGRIARTGALHQAVRLMYAGLVPMVPGSEESPVDLIAVDYAVNAVAHLATEGFQPGATWHVGAGEQVVPLGMLLDLTLTIFREQRPGWRKRAIERPAPVDLPTFALFCQSVDEVGDAPLRASTAAISHFAPQLVFPKRFDNSRCRAALERAGILPPPIRGVWSRMVTRLIQPAHADLESRLLDFVRATLLNGRAVSIDADTYLFDGGLIDSLKILQLIAFVETEIGRSIADPEVVMENFRSVRVIAERFGPRA
jgi:nucleoside-diphosphate-sugar epimerase/acyl carrier protein